MAKVRVGLIGCGGMGRALMAQAATLDDAAILTVSDLDEQRRGEAAEQFGAEGIADYHDILARDDIDAVFVATPGGYHKQVVLDAAEAGKHVFSEKPLATTVADCDAMIAAVEKAGVKHMTGQVCRYHPTHSGLKRMVDDGTLGPVLSIYVERVSGRWGGAHPPWRYSYALSGGNLMEINAHELDFMLWLCGPVKRVYAVGELFLEDRIDYRNVMFVSLNFASGAVGVLNSSGIAEVGAVSARVDCQNGSAAAYPLFNGDIRYKIRGAEAAGVVPIDELKGDNPVLGEVKAFIEAVRDDTTPPVSFHDGRAAVQVAELAYLSAERGAPIDV